MCPHFLSSHTRRLSPQSICGTNSLTNSHPLSTRSSPQHTRNPVFRSDIFKDISDRKLTKWKNLQKIPLVLRIRAKVGKMIYEGVFSAAHSPLLQTQALIYFLKCIMFPPPGHLSPSQGLCTRYFKTPRIMCYCESVQATRDGGTMLSHFTLCTVSERIGENQKDMETWTITIWTCSFGGKVLAVNSVNMQSDKVHPQVLQRQSEPRPAETEGACVRPGSREKAPHQISVFCSGEWQSHNGHLLTPKIKCWENWDWRWTGSMCGPASN